MTLGELAEREMVSGNRVQPAGLLRTLRRQLIREVQRASVIGNVKHAAATQCRELRKRVFVSPGRFYARQLIDRVDHLTAVSA
jgi:hypothetical protein